MVRVLRINFLPDLRKCDSTIYMENLFTWSLRFRWNVFKHTIDIFTVF